MRRPASARIVLLVVFCVSFEVLLVGAFDALRRGAPRQEARNDGLAKVILPASATQVEQQDAERTDQHP